MRATPSSHACHQRAACHPPAPARLQARAEVAFRYGPAEGTGPAGALLLAQQRADATAAPQEAGAAVGCCSPSAEAAAAGAAGPTTPAARAGRKRTATVMFEMPVGGAEATQPLQPPPRTRRVLAPYRWGARAMKAKTGHASNATRGPARAAAAAAAAASARAMARLHARAAAGPATAAAAAAAAPSAAGAAITAAPAVSAANVPPPAAPGSGACGGGAGGPEPCPARRRTQPLRALRGQRPLRLGGLQQPSAAGAVAVAGAERLCPQAPAKAAAALAATPRAPPAAVVGGRSLAREAAVHAAAAATAPPPRRASELATAKRARRAAQAHAVQLSQQQQQQLLQQVPCAASSDEQQLALLRLAPRRQPVAPPGAALHGLGPCPLQQPQARHCHQLPGSASAQQPRLPGPLLQPQRRQQQQAVQSQPRPHRHCSGRACHLGLAATDAGGAAADRQASGSQCSTGTAVLAGVPVGASGGDAAQGGDSRVRWLDLSSAALLLRAPAASELQGGRAAAGWPQVGAGAASHDRSGDGGVFWEAAAMQALWPIGGLAGAGVGETLPCNDSCGAFGLGSGPGHSGDGPRMRSLQRAPLTAGPGAGQAQPPATGRQATQRQQQQQHVQFMQLLLQQQRGRQGHQQWGLHETEAGAAARPGLPPAAAPPIGQLQLQRAAAAGMTAAAPQSLAWPAASRPPTQPVAAGLPSAGDARPERLEHRAGGMPLPAAAEVHTSGGAASTARCPGNAGVWMVPPVEVCSLEAPSQLLLAACARTSACQPERPGDGDARLRWLGTAPLFNGAAVRLSPSDSRPVDEARGRAQMGADAHSTAVGWSPLWSGVAASSFSPSGLRGVRALPLCDSNAWDGRGALNGFGGFASSPCVQPAGRAAPCMHAGAPPATWMACGHGSGAGGSRAADAGGGDWARLDATACHHRQQQQQQQPGLCSAGSAQPERSQMATVNTTAATAALQHVATAEVRHAQLLWAVAAAKGAQQRPHRPQHAIARA
jgi:hypothetical protein